MQTFAERMTRLGYEIDTTTSGTLQKSLFKLKDAELRKVGALLSSKILKAIADKALQGMETLLLKTLSRAKYVVAGRTRQNTFSHFALNLPLYTHFTNPFRRYADIIVHRQLEAALSNGAIDFTEDLDNLGKIADQCNTKKDSAQAAQEQSVHIESCRMMDAKWHGLGGGKDLISEGVVICVYESAFDVVIPEYGFEKRVHCDQLPLKKAEWRKETRTLELYWEKGVTSSAYVPEDERPKGGSGGRSGSASGPSGGGMMNGRVGHGSTKKEEEKPIETGSRDADAVDALFDHDDDSASEIAEMASGVSLGPREEKRGMSTLGLFECFEE